MPQRPHQDIKVLIVSEHASAAFGGEAALPLHYFRALRKRGNSVWLVVHARTRAELAALFPEETRIHYIEDTRFHRLMNRLSGCLPARVSAATFGYAVRISTQLAQRSIVRRLVAENGIDIIHQPMPVSPREPSLMFNLGAPIVIGPMNGAMDFPPAFAEYESSGSVLFVRFGRALSGLLNRLMPGKLRCAVLAVANERTRRALPPGFNGKVIEVVENGVDLDLWTSRECAEEPESDAPTRFVFIGRLVDWKAVDLLIAAFAQAAESGPMTLTVAGDGPERSRLESVAERLGRLAAREGDIGKVFFLGWQSQAECASLLSRSSALVLPSLRECGGAVVLEAMASSRPVIATDWGGPADYLDPTCGVLVKPISKSSFISDLRDAINRLSLSYELRVQMGRAGRNKVLNRFDWDSKVEHFLSIYFEVLRETTSNNSRKID